MTLGDKHVSLGCFRVADRQAFRSQGDYGDRYYNENFVDPSRYTPPAPGQP